MILRSLRNVGNCDPKPRKRTDRWRPSFSHCGRPGSTAEILSPHENGEISKDRDSSAFSTRFAQILVPLARNRSLPSQFRARGSRIRAGRENFQNQQLLSSSSEKVSDCPEPFQIVKIVEDLPEFQFGLTLALRQKVLIMFGGGAANVNVRTPNVQY